MIKKRITKICCFRYTNVFDKKYNKPIIIDVRTKKEWIDGHISCAIGPLPIHEKPQNLNKTLVDITGNLKNRTIFVYCRSGRRSEIAKNVLEKLGYTDVRNGGGFKENRKELEKICKL